jgi:hypothetical protein
LDRTLLAQRRSTCAEARTHQSWRSAVQRADGADATGVAPLILRESPNSGLGTLAADMFAMDDKYEISGLNGAAPATHPATRASACRTQAHFRKRER